MNKQQLKQIIKECIQEVIDENDTLKIEDVKDKIDIKGGWDFPECMSTHPVQVLVQSEYEGMSIYSFKNKQDAIKWIELEKLNSNNNTEFHGPYTIKRV